MSPAGARPRAVYPFHRQAFILPPWRAIDVHDAERGHPYRHAEAVHASLLRWYRRCGYTLHELPCVPVAERAAQVLAVLGPSR
jgi:predicted ATPase